MSHLSTALALAAACGAVTHACALPSDRSYQLHIVVDSLLVLNIGGQARLFPRLVDAEGAEIPAAFQFLSDNPAVARVFADGIVRAGTSGVARITVHALGFTQATADRVLVRVRTGIFDVDSTRPLTVRFGEVLTLYGVGLRPESLLSVTVGGVPAPVRSYTVSSEGVERLELWVVPPAPSESGVSLLGRRGSAESPDTITVLQQDLLEPNDSAPARLGTLAAAFANPGLALEVTRRTPVYSYTVDWYTFTNAQAQDRTIVVRASRTPPADFLVTVADSLYLGSGGYLRPQLRPQGWGLSSGSSYVGSCGGRRLGFSFRELADSFVVALKDLPPGTYHVAVEAWRSRSAPPAPYELRIEPAYRSSLPPDAAEENDYCDAAYPIGLPLAAGQFSIDTPHDLDWFRFSLTGGPQTVSITGQAEESAAELQFAVFDADSLTWVLCGLLWGPRGTVSRVLAPGQYFLVVSDHIGRPTRYTLEATVGPASGAGALGVEASRRSTPPTYCAGLRLEGR